MKWIGIIDDCGGRHIYHEALVCIKRDQNDPCWGVWVKGESMYSYDRICTEPVVLEHADAAILWLRHVCPSDAPAKETECVFGNEHGEWAAGDGEGEG